MLKDVARETVSNSEENSPDFPATVRRPSATSALRGLLWAEWFAHSKLVLVFLCIWLAAVWLIPLFAHPGWILVLGGLYALVAGPLYGGGDILEGCEEFSFTLPPTRESRYIARLTVGGGTFLVLTGFNLLTLGLDLPQILARFYIDTGIVEPLPNLRLGLLYGLVVALPFAAFAFSFAISAITHSRWLVLTAWFWGGLGALTVLQLGFWYEGLVWSSLTGNFSCPLLFLSAVAGLIAGYAVYRKKEIGLPSAPLILPSRFWVWFSLFLIGTGIAVTLVGSIAKLIRQFLSGGSE